MNTTRMVLVLAALSAAGCSGVQDAGALPLQGQTADDFEWQSAMRAGSTLEIKGVNGTVEAVPASGATARVTAVRRARGDDDPMSVEIVVVEHAAGVTICAVPPSPDGRANECAPGDEGRLRSRNSRVTVAFTVEIPAGIDFSARNTNGSITVGELRDRVEALSTNGDIEVDGGADVIARTTNGSIVVRSAGEADARTTNGRITAELGAVNPTGDPLTFTTTNGSVIVRLPENANASIEARTTNGSIESDLPMTIGTVSRRVLSGRIGSGGREIELQTTNGSIDIERVR